MHLESWSPSSYGSQSLITNAWNFQLEENPDFVIEPQYVIDQNKTNSIKQREIAEVDQTGNLSDLVILYYAKEERQAEMERRQKPGHADADPLIKA